ncbi:MAG TPA: sigma-70 family RNA polymerase sigma factor [Longimicrobiales bacterium]|nr:sigma-70 family RNA polymerase sigma factor [Longimicrobiales bacterium]
MSEFGELNEITQLLVAAGKGVDGAMDDVFASVYPRLRQLARSRRRAWQGNNTLDTTALIHEAYLKVSSSGSPRYENRGHFFAVAAQAMRQVLINYAEKKSAQKRGGGAAHVTLHERDLVSENALDEILTLDDALRRLEVLSPRQARVVECLFFAGFTVEETAEALETSPATVKRDWSAARAWLFRAMHADPDPDAT